jgi:hypothetical protein
MFNRSRAVLFAALALAGGVSPALHSTARPQVIVSSKRKKGMFNGLPIPSADLQMGFRASRNTVARAKRVAQRRQNQSRHKRVVKG